MSDFSLRITHPIGGNRSSGAGAFADLPIKAFNTQDWAVREFDFTRVSEYDATNDFTLTQVTSGAASVVASNTGLLTITSGAQNQGPIIQMKTVGVLPSAASATAQASDAVFAARFNIVKAGATNLGDFFIGFAEINSGSAVITGAGVITSDTHAGFRQTLSVANGAVRTSVAGTVDTTPVTAAAFTLVGSIYYDVAVRVRGTLSASFYMRHNGRTGGSTIPKPWSYLGSHTPAEAWDARMFPTFAFIADNAGDVMNVDRIVYACKRDLTIA